MMGIPTRDLRKALADYRRIAERIRDEFPDQEDEDLRDTIFGETYLDGAIAAVLREANATIAMADGLGELIADLLRRQDRLQMRAERLKAMALWAAQEAGERMIAAPDFVAVISPGRDKAVIIDETLLPLEYLTIHPPTPDKKAIRAALKEGEVVPGAELGNRMPHWVVRR